MKKNLLIENGQTATNILLAYVPMAQTFSDNDAKLYLIDCQLSNYRGNNIFARLWVWAVKSGKRTYTGLVCTSGIIPDGQTEILSGVFVSFVEENILNDEDENLNRKEVHPGVIIRLNANGKYYLKEEIKIPDNIIAELELKKRNPKLKGGATLLRIGDPKALQTYWAIMGEKGYESISPFTGETVVLPRNLPAKPVMIDEPAGKGFYLKLLRKQKKFVLSAKKATIR